MTGWTGVSKALTEVVGVHNYRTSRHVTLYKKATYGHGQASVNTAK